MKSPIRALAAGLLCGACATGEEAHQDTAAVAFELRERDGEAAATTEDGPDAGGIAESPDLAAAVGQAGAERPDPAADGWLDASAFLSKKFGFLPVALPITEPAVGYGAAAGVAFISKSLGDAAAGHGRPNITFVGGFGTENDSRGVAVGDVRHWCDDRIQTVAAVIRSSVNLDFYGLAGGAYEEARQVNLEPQGGFLQAKFRLGDSALWAGASYAYVSTEVTFDVARGTPGIPETDRISHVGGITPSLTWDTRDNIFTPTRGTFVEANCGIYAPALGADTEFQRAKVLAMHYEPLTTNLFLGVRGQVTSTFGHAPFYVDPFVSLRGVPVMRYQGETAADLEAELRWQFWKRFSVVGFGGVGAAGSRHEGAQSVVSGGFGVRYELARDFGIHFGLDVAFSDGAGAIYLQIGERLGEALIRRAGQTPRRVARSLVRTPCGSSSRRISRKRSRFG